jgi:TatA/E family protein of Tat protein translocase
MIPAFSQVGTTELLIVLFIILLLFGAKCIPQLARSLVAAPGSSVRASPEITTKSPTWGTEDAIGRDRSY